MHALTLLVAATDVDALCDRLCDELDALSASIEDADAGTADEAPVFDEPGVASTSTWQRARISALFADEAAATAAAAALAAASGDATLRIESIDAVARRTGSDSPSRSSARARSRRRSGSSPPGPRFRPKRAR
jgi:ribosomal protein L11 methyltransferase